MPKFYAYGNSQNLVTTETLDEIIKNAGIDMTRFQVFPAYNGDSSNFANLRQIQIKGKLKPNEKLAFNINLQVSGLTDQDLYNNSFNNIGAWLFDSNGNTASTATAYFRFANQVKSPADSDAKYLATYYSNGVYTVAPEDVQNIMPQMNADHEISISNFGQGPQNAHDTRAYTGGSFYVNLSKIKEYLANLGYSVGVGANGKVVDYYAYRISGTQADLVNQNGTPYVPGKNQGLYIQIRKVVTVDPAASDQNILTGDNYSTNGIEVYDHKGIIVPFDSTDIKVTSDLNNEKPGVYHVTYTYLPDMVSRTFTVNVFELKASDATIYVGQKIPTGVADYKATALDDNGNPIPVIVSVDDKNQQGELANEPGDYDVTFTIANGLKIKKTLHVLKDRSSVTAKDITIHVGDKVPDASAFGASVTDEDGNDSNHNGQNSDNGNDSNHNGKVSDNGKASDHDSQNKETNLNGNNQDQQSKENSNNNQKSGTLPNTGQQNASLLELIGASILEFLGLIGFKKFKKN